MKTLGTARWVALLAMTISLSGCWFKKKPTIVPVITPRPEPKQEPTPAPPPKQEPQPPPVVEPAKPTPQPEQQTPAEKPSPAPSAPKRRRPAPQTPPPTQQQPPPQEAPATTNPPAVPIPQLGELLTPEKRKQYEDECEQRLRRARAVLAQTAGRTLTPSQSESAGRIRSFIRQAEELRGRDIATALQLARRADLLGQDLSQTLQ